jgi:DNA-directed RNA polymerase subunit RPC12/RpoP
MTKKLPAHDKWVCLRCRWTAKLPRLDVRTQDRPGYRCPKCNAQLLWTGTAFRPPRKGDDEGWRVVEKLLEAGFRFHATRQRHQVPRTLKEVSPWLEARSEPEGWLAERMVSVGTRDAGPVVRWGRMELPHRQRVLIWADDGWCEGSVLLRGDGGSVLARPVVKLKRAGRSIPLSSQSRVRVPDTRDV